MQALKRRLEAAADPVLLACLILAGIGAEPSLLLAEQARGDTPARTVPTPETLVGRLSSPSFQEREEAAKALRALGAKAVPALMAGLKSGSLEEAERCKRVLVDIRKVDLARFLKAFADDADRKAKFDHPIWLRWSKVVGDDRYSRELLTEVLAAAGAAETLDRLEADPKSAATLYPGELGRLHAIAAERSLGPDGRTRRGMTSCLSLGEAAYGVYLGSYPGATTVKPGVGRGGLPVDPEMEVLQSICHLLYKNRGAWSAEVADKGEYQRGNRPLNGSKNRLLVAALLNLKNPRAIEHGLRWDGGLRDVQGDELTVCLPLVRMVCHEKAFAIEVRAASWPYLAEAGETDYLRDIAAHQTDATRVQQFWRSDEGHREYTVLVSDVSIAAQLIMHKQAIKDFGFLPKLNEAGRVVDKSCFAFGFPDSATRQAAHARALAFLAKAPKPSTTAK
jgi:hypothetical protein